MRYVAHKRMKAAILVPQYITGASQSHSVVMHASAGSNLLDYVCYGWLSLRMLTLEQPCR